MNIVIRQETSFDHDVVFSLVEKAFRGVKHSDNREHFLVERLRRSEVFIPELSLVAEVGNEIVGHILLTKIKIENDTPTFDSLALAPVSVLPEFQGKGVGGKLIADAHDRAKELGYASIILLGEPKYYSRFGYVPAKTYNIYLPFEGVEEFSMAIELTENALQNVSGTVAYPKEFYE